MSTADRRAERRELLLDAAFDLLGTAGWSATTVRSVVERSALNPRYFEAYNNRGFAKAHLQDYQGAITDYTEAIRLNLQHPLPHRNRGDARAAVRPSLLSRSTFGTSGVWPFGATR